MRAHTFDYARGYARGYARRPGLCAKLRELSRHSDKLCHLMRARILAFAQMTKLYARLQEALGCAIGPSGKCCAIGPLTNVVQSARLANVAQSVRRGHVAELAPWANVAQSARLANVVQSARQR